MNIEQIIETYDNLPAATVAVCHCKHCKAAKNRTSTNNRKLSKRLLNKKRRSLKQSGKRITHYWA